MRTLSPGFLACAVYVLAPALAFGQPQAPPRPGGGMDQLPKLHELAQILQPHVPPSLEVDKEIAGLSASSHPEVLTWERVYALALCAPVAAPGCAPRPSTRRPLQNRPRGMGSPTSAGSARSSSPPVAVAMRVSTTRAATSSRSWTGSRGSTVRDGMSHSMRMYSH